MEEIRYAYVILVRKPGRKRPFGRPTLVDVSIILKWTLKKQVMDWIHLIRVESSGGICDQDNEPSGSIKVELLG
jgi:hypothetical protein